VKAGSLARACSAVGRNAISAHFRFRPIQTTITAVLEVLLIALACFLAGLFARTMRAQRIVRDLSQTLRHWIGDTVQRARSGRANLIGLLMKSMQFRLVLGINEPPLTNGFPGGPSSRRSHASLQCSIQKAMAAHDDTTLVMMDLVNYSATETLRDGRAVEVRAQRSPGSRRHASGDRAIQFGVASPSLLRGQARMSGRIYRRRQVNRRATSMSSSATCGPGPTH